MQSKLLYFWVYEQGLKQRPWKDVLHDIQVNRNCEDYDKFQKNMWKYRENYLNGYNRGKQRKANVFDVAEPPSSKQEDSTYLTLEYSEYPIHPYLGQEEIQNRWVPCGSHGKPIIKWGQGCKTYADALALAHDGLLAENLLGTKFIVIDCDGNHGNGDAETVKFLRKFWEQTHTMVNPRDGRSFHLTFLVDREIPTKHSAAAHIDICGNKRNQLRYLKDKVWNQRSPIPMTDEIWKEIREYIREREEGA